jgi:hypothetical protein
LHTGSYNTGFFLHAAKKSRLLKISAFRIRIRIGFGFNQVSESESGIRIQEAKMTHKIEKSEEILCFEVLDVII